MIGYFLNTININLFVEIISFAFSFLCHQDKTILVQYYSGFIPLCPRCIGLHYGFFPALAVLLIKENERPFSFKRVPKLIPALLATIAGIHWLGGSLEIFGNNSHVRFFTGLISGFSFSFLLFNYQEFKGVHQALLKAFAKVYLYSIPPLTITVLLLKELKLLILMLGLIVLLNSLALFVALYSLFRIPAYKSHCLTT